MIIKIKCKKCGHEDVVVSDKTNFLPLECRQCKTLNKKSDPILETEVLDDDFDAALLSNDMLEVQNLKTTFRDVLTREEIPRCYKKISQIDDMVLFKNRKTEALIQFRVITINNKSYYCR